MDHGTMRPAPAHEVITGPPGASGSPRHGTARLSLAVDGQRLRGQTASVATQWRPDTPRHRPLAVVGFRLLVDEHGTPLFTLQELAVSVGSANRQAASQPLEDLRQCGEDLHAFMLRQRTVEATVVDAVLADLLHPPLAGPQV